MIRSTVSLASILACQLCWGQQAEILDSDAGDSEREPMEEIVVNAPQSLGSIAAAVTKAQIYTYSVFNALNLDNDYDVLCRKERRKKQGSNPINNHAPITTCLTTFVRRETARDNEIIFEGGDPGDSDVDYSAHVEELRQKVNTLARQHPELKQAMVEWAALKGNYNEAKAEEMKGNFFTRLFKSKDKS